LVIKKSLLKFLLKSLKELCYGGDLRLNNRKLKVKALPKKSSDFVEADITPLNMGNKLYVTQVPPDFKIMQQHSNLSSEDFSCS
jgi:large subunit ribosomal protein L25